MKSNSLEVQSMSCNQWRGHGCMGGGQVPPHFGQYGSRDFLKVDEKIGGKGVVANLQRSRGCGQKINELYDFVICSCFIAPITFM